MVDPISLILFGIFGIATIVVLTFWNQILSWASDALFPWLDKYMPSVAGEVRLAFDALDKLITPIRREVKRAWQSLRNYLLKQVIEFSRKKSVANSYEWVKKTTMWLIKVLDSGERTTVKVETTSTVPWEEVPDDVRAEFLRQNKQKTSVDVTEVRDREMEQMEVAG